MMIVWTVVGACWVVVTVAVFVAAGVVVIGGRVGAGGPVLLVIVPVVPVGSGGSRAGRGGIGKVSHKDTKIKMKPKHVLYLIKIYEKRRK